jgi:brefeldin A-inhibited guanine nucleotide-exchange protein
MANSTTAAVKDMILRCLIQMIQARGDNIRSGWKTMFGVFTVAAREPYGKLSYLLFSFFFAFIRSVDFFSFIYSPSFV